MKKTDNNRCIDSKRLVSCPQIGAAGAGRFSEQIDTVRDLKMKKTTTGMDAMVNAAKTHWMGMGNSLAGLIQRVCASCGTTRLGEERSSFWRGLSKSGAAKVNSCLRTWIPVWTSTCGKTFLFKNIITNLNAGIIICAGVLGLATAASGDAVMSITTIDYTVANHDGDALNVGDETMFTYLIKNNSEDLPTGENNLIQLKLPGGINQGVFYAIDSSGLWDVEVIDDFTVLTSTGNQYLSGQDSMYVYQLSSRTDGTRIGTATAVAAGDGYGTNDFNAVDVVSPADIIFTNGVTMRWLKEHGYTNDFETACLLDPDSDGFLNWQEYVADTNPTNGQSFLSVGTDSTNLFFSSSLNCSYSVEWSESLSSSNVWNVLTNDVSGTGEIVSVSDPYGAVSRFYRLKAERR